MDINWYEKDISTQQEQKHFLQESSVLPTQLES